MNLKRTGFVTWLTLMLIGTTFCGSGGKAPEGSAPSTAQNAPPATLTPAELGRSIGSLYYDALTELTQTLKDRPEPQAIKANVLEIREGYIRKLVALGKLRELMSEGDRKTVDAQIGMKLGGVPSDLFNLYSQAHQYYSPKDRELAELMSGFNIITQYANFDLLKKQAPAEAARLGIN
jgi:hypothetical protein